MRKLLWLAVFLAQFANALACPGAKSPGPVTGRNACVIRQRAVLEALERFGQAHACQPLWHLARGENPATYVAQSLRDPVPKCISTHQPRIDPRPLVVELQYGFVQDLRRLHGLAFHPPDCRYDSPGAISLRLTSFGDGITCTAHGDLTSPTRFSPREQLQRHGVTETTALFEASAIPQSIRPLSKRQDPAPMLMLFVAIVVGAIWRLRQSRNTTGARLAMSVCISISHAILCLAAIGVCEVAGCQTVMPVPVAAAAACAGSVAAGMMLLGWEVAVALVGVGAALAAHAPARPAPAPRLLTLAPDLRCAVCGTHDGPEEWVGCPTCETSHHTDCWTYQDGCAVYGCDMAHGRWRAGRAPRVN